MKIDKDIVHSLSPCSDGYDWYLKHGSEDLLETLLAVSKERPEWARWLFTRLMTLNQRRQIAIFAAEQVIGIFEKEYPDDTRPRKAIDAAKMVLLADTEENRGRAKNAANAAYAAASAAYAAANAADAADAAYAAADAADAAYAAAYAAYAAANAADAAAYAANAADAAAYAAYAADAAANAANAADAADATRVQMQETIIREAVRILDNGVSK